jgi:hypothetical protein
MKGHEPPMDTWYLGKEIDMLEKEPLENGSVQVTFRVSHYIWADST